MSEQFQAILKQLKLNIEIGMTADKKKLLYRIVTPIITNELAFELGKEIQDTYVDGRKYSVSWDTINK